MIRPWITTTMSRVMLRHVEGELGAALVERAEQERRQHDAHGVVAAHQRDRDADEAGAGREVQDQAVLHAHDLVEATQPGERARRSTWRR